MPVVTLPTQTTPPILVLDDAESTLFGVDFLFTDDLQVTGSGDYAVVTGMDALKQAIKILLITSPGDYATNPAYGCGLSNFVKKRATKSDRDTLRQTIIDQLTQDPRIQSVNDVVVESSTYNNQPAVTITCNITALGKEQSFSLNNYVG